MKRKKSRRKGRWDRNMVEKELGGKRMKRKKRRRKRRMRIMMMIRKGERRENGTKRGCERNGGKRMRSMKGWEKRRKTR